MTQRITDITYVHDHNNGNDRFTFYRLAEDYATNEDARDIIHSYKNITVSSWNRLHTVLDTMVRHDKFRLTRRDLRVPRLYKPTQILTEDSYTRRYTG